MDIRVLTIGCLLGVSTIPAAPRILDAIGVAGGFSIGRTNASVTDALGEYRFTTTLLGRTVPQFSLRTDLFAGRLFTHMVDVGWEIPVGRDPIPAVTDASSTSWRTLEASVLTLAYSFRFRAPLNLLRPYIGSGPMVGFIINPTETWVGDKPVYSYSSYEWKKAEFGIQAMAGIELRVATLLISIGGGYVAFLTPILKEQFYRNGELLCNATYMDNAIRINASVLYRLPVRGSTENPGSINAKQ